MPTFNAGDTITILLGADDRLTFDGAGRYTCTLANGTLTTGVLTGRQYLGAFQQTASISIFATAGGSYSTAFQRDLTDHIEDHRAMATGGSLITNAELSTQLVGLGVYKTPESFGAKGDGVTDDTAALQAAIEALRSTDGTLRGCLIGSGIYRTTASIDMNGGFVDVSLPASASQAFSIKLTLKPDASVQDVAILRNAISPKVVLHIVGGGTGASGHGLRIYKLRNPEFHVVATNYNGNVIYYNHNDGDVQEIVGSSVYSLNCYRCLALFGSSSGFGHITAVWDVNSSNGSIIQDIADIGVSHFENFSSDSAAGPNLYINGGTAIHFTTLALGQGGATLLSINNAERVDIDKFYGYGGSDGARDVSAILVKDSAVSIATLVSKLCGNGLVVNGGSNVNIGSLLSYDNMYDVNVTKGDSTQTWANVAIGSLRSVNVQKESLRADNTVLTGCLQIGAGAITAGNQSNTAGIYAVKITAPVAYRFVPIGLTVDVGANAYAGSVTLTDAQQMFAQRCSFAGGVFVGSTRKVSDDGQSFAITSPASPLVAGTDYTNNYGRPIYVTQPVSLNTTSVAAWAAFQITDPSGTVLDLIDRVELQAGSGTTLHVIKCLVPSGWKYQFKRSTSAVTASAPTQILAL